MSPWAHADIIFLLQNALQYRMFLTISQGFYRFPHGTYSAKQIHEVLRKYDNSLGRELLGVSYVRSPEALL